MKVGVQADGRVPVWTFVFVPVGALGTLRPLVALFFVGLGGPAGRGAFLGEAAGGERRLKDP
ncbi:hypothetical protein [Phenylobacterium sp.]|uniref:hypothetical protein n=1 Tax=Phenylobacterium sp. TaxID=1871053 RepID=UPI0025FF5981|nr:hypothetical protein [Phenylobacterium sp.]MBX3485713.1 hypothetical protein [Phenylobacterium sp.]